jgi:hypothetical protein
MIAVPRSPTKLPARSVREPQRNYDISVARVSGAQMLGREENVSGICWFADGLQVTTYTAFG